MSDTKQVLRKCGLSRLPDEQVVTLDILSHDDAKGAIRAVFDAYDFKGPDQATWVDKLASLSQGWPQHINRVSVAAGRVIHRNGGGIQPNLLQSAIAMGQERKNDYYASRLEACSEDPWIYKQLAEAAGERNGLLSWDEIDSISERMRNKMGLSTNDFLADALHAGVLMDSKSLPDHYKIPIPSFGDYLRELPL
ncbi:MAG: hypothetical protein OXD01_14245 [Gammaproteobacteria bacterium]|nr:hypothetical protein [Gammaproteobacteria bacterium]